MRRILVTVAIVLAVPALTLGQAAPQSTGCEQTAKKLELIVGEITQNFDRAGYERLVSDDAVLINSLGEAKSKKEEVASLNRPAELTFISFTTEDVKIRVCGETSIVTAGRDVMKARMKGEKEELVQSYWFIRIYEKRRGQWQLVYNQLTDVRE